jgi:uncharacterized protein YndB with AHSA1/START domain
MEFNEGGHWHYAMIAPDGQAFWNRLDYQTIRPIDGYVALDGFCDETGVVNADLPRARWDVAFTEAKERTLVTTIVVYNSADDVQKAIDMGLKDGLASTLERLDELLCTIVAPEERA